jgi:hypothetical protein
MVDRIRKKYQGIEVDQVAALREAEAALTRGDLETAGKHMEDYEGFRAWSGKEPPGGKEKHDLVQKRLSSLKKEPWLTRPPVGLSNTGVEFGVSGCCPDSVVGAARLDP